MDLTIKGIENGVAHTHHITHSYLMIYEPRVHNKQCDLKHFIIQKKRLRLCPLITKTPETYLNVCIPQIYQIIETSIYMLTFKQCFSVLFSKLPIHKCCMFTLKCN